jgi:general secretion pathway protein H
VNQYLKNPRNIFLNTKTGFTLIELLIVLVIIGIVASFAVLNVNVNQTKRLEAISHQIADLLRHAQQEALLRPATLAFAPQSTGYAFYEFKLNRWQLITDSVLKKRTLPKDVLMKTQLVNSEEKEDKVKNPKVIISPSGELTPFSIRVGKKNQSALFSIMGDANGQIKVKRLNET